MSYIIGAGVVSLGWLLGEPHFVTTGGTPVTAQVPVRTFGFIFEEIQVWIVEE